MTVKEIKSAFTVLELRERLIFMLAVLAGMRPGEILALRRGGVVDNIASIKERIYRGKLDTPKTPKSQRPVALMSLILVELQVWLSKTPDTGPDGWLFPSEKLTTPLAKDNVMRRNIRPRLKAVQLGWVDFHVMRRTHSSLMHEIDVDPKIVADLMGHDVDVNLNVYTQTSLENRIEAVKALEEVFRS